MLPMQIRFTKHEVSLTAAPVPYSVSVVSEMDFAFLVEDQYGELFPMTPYEFARGCRSAACIPQRGGGSLPSGGTGGGDASKSDVATPTRYAVKGNFVGKDADDADRARVLARSKGAVIGSDGLLVESFLGPKGEVTLTPAQEKAAAKKMAELGTSEAEWIDNLVAIGGKSMNENAARALEESKWYQKEHDEWGQPLSKAYDVSIDQVMAIAASTSTNKKWDFVKSSNKEVTERILKLLKDDEKITITPEQAAAYGQFSIDKVKTGGKYGPRTLEPGEYRLSELSSGTLARVLGSGYQIGGQYGTDGLYKAFAVARGEITPNQAIGSLKQRSFTNNLVHPDKDYSSTNDFWMARAMLGTGVVNLPVSKANKAAGLTGPQTVREWEQAKNGQPNTVFGSDPPAGSSAMFAVATRASRKALDRLQEADPRFRGMKMHEFQAVVWVQMQREYLERYGDTGDDEE